MSLSYDPEATPGLLDALREISDAGVRKLDPEEAVRQSLKALHRLFGISGAVIRYEQDERLSGWLMTLPDCEDIPPHITADLESQFRRASPVSLPQHPCTFEPVPAENRGLSPKKSEWTLLPIQTEEDFLGMLFVSGSSPSSPEADLQPLRHALTTCLLLARSTRRLLTTDPLTGAFNRWFLDIELEKACAGLRDSVSPFALMIVDVDHFKSINDRLGHATGDQVLIRLVEFLQASVSEKDVVIRMGGDEFLIWLPDLAGRDPELFGTELVRNIPDSIQLPETRDFRITVSMGLVLQNPEQEVVERATMMERADVALYQSKRQGRNRLSVWQAGSSKEPGPPAGPSPENGSVLRVLQGRIEVLQSEAESTQEQIVELLESMLSAKEHETALHSIRVAKVTAYLLEHLDFSPKEKTEILRGARLHDIGKLAIPDAILHKTDPLTSSEWTVLQQHPRLGQRFVENFRFLQEPANIILYHHERFDGTGYPSGLKAEDIPLGARLFSLVDAYDGMRGNRIYKTSTPKDEVLAEMKRQSGKQFDPELVDFFLQHVEAIEEIGKWE